MGIGVRLKEARKAKGWSQATLEAESGVSQQMISKLENGTSDSTSFIADLADALNVDVHWLNSGKGKMADNHATNESAPSYNAASSDAQSIATRYDALPPTLRNLVDQQLQQAEALAAACDGPTLKKYHAQLQANKIIASGALDEFITSPKANAKKHRA